MNFTKMTTLLCAGLVSTSVSFARYTTIMDATSGSEPSLYEILDTVAFVPEGWNSTADLNAGAGGRRIDDNADQFWQSGTYKVSVVSSFWSGAASPTDNVDQYFRYDENLDGSNPVDLTHLDTPGDSDSFTISNGTFIIGDGGGIFDAWSNEALNSGSLTDRAVTFDVTGLDVYAWTAGDKDSPTGHLLSSSSQLPAYIIGFDVGRDGDYQDKLFLVESIQPIVVPAPGAIILGGIGLFAARWLRQKRLIN